jgi:hypothetical protein
LDCQFIDEFLISDQNYWQSCGSSKIDADLDSIGDCDRGDFFHLSSGAFKIDVSLEDGHLPVIPGLGSLTAGTPSAADAQVLVGESDGSWDLDALGLGVANQLVGHLLDSIKSVSAEGDSSSLELGIFNALFLGVLVSHIWLILSNIIWLIK